MSQRHDRTTFGRWRLIHVCQNGGRGRDIMQLLWARFGCQLLTRFLDAHSYLGFKVSDTFGTCTFSTRTIRYPLALVLHFHQPHFLLVTCTILWSLMEKSHVLRQVCFLKDHTIVYHAFSWHLQWSNTWWNLDLTSLQGLDAQGSIRANERLLRTPSILLVAKL